jgi:Spy/CpxP family protein refolding chaperone
MRPVMVHWWKRDRGGMRCGAHAGGGHAAYEVGEGIEARHGGGGFGVRRPLRFLAWKLGLNEAQITELATILDELKTERAQASVDDRRALTAFAEALDVETFDEAKAKTGASTRTKSGERLQGELVRALTRIHALLDQEQRAKLAYLIRTGALAL